MPNLTGSSGLRVEEKTSSSSQSSSKMFSDSTVCRQAVDRRGVSAASSTREPSFPYDPTSCAGRFSGRR